jgi:ceramide glucosyltransferase
MVVAGLTTALACAGVAQGLIGARLVTGFARQVETPVTDLLPISVLKPLYGAEPLLEEALATICRQAYPVWQIVFGVQDRADPAVRVVERLRTQFPESDMSLVIDPTRHGRNLKVGNLINMLPAARHDILVIADSDVHVRPDYLARLAEALSRPRIGLVTTLYAGLPAWSNIVTRLGAAQITYGFLPGALLARAMGRQDCLGATMCLRRADLDRIGGLRALIDHLADDNVLGRRIRGLGLDVALAHTVPLTTVPEVRAGVLFRHELRWARTIRALEPAGFAASILQYSLFWAFLTIVAAGASLWSLGLFACVWIMRAAAGLRIDGALAPRWGGDQGMHRGRALGQGRDDPTGLAFSCPVWLLPLRDVLSVAVMLASYAGRRVDWRGHGLHADTPPPCVAQPEAEPPAMFRPIEGTNTR